LPENKKAVQRRIRAVKNIQQITKAQKMISVVKLRRAQQKVLATRPYSRELAKTIARLVARGAGAQHPLIAPRQDRATVAYVVVTADRGMAGPFNMNVIRKAAAVMQADPRPQKLIAIGRKGRDYFLRRGIKPVLEFTGFGEEPSFALTRQMVAQIVDLYLKGEVDEVRLIYTEFASAVSYRPVEVQLLPVQPPEAEAQDHSILEHIYVPSAEDVLNVLVPRFVDVSFYQALLESKASEHGARMTAMSNAVDKAGEMIQKLTLAYNRARQAAITKEISEIVGGAEALKG